MTFRDMVAELVEYKVESVEYGVTDGVDSRCFDWSDSKVNTTDYTPDSLIRESLEFEEQ